MVAADFGPVGHLMNGQFLGFPRCAQLFANRWHIMIDSTPRERWQPFNYGIKVIKLKPASRTGCGKKLLLLELRRGIVS
jgi:hypothetical protein